MSVISLNRKFEGFFLNVKNFGLLLNLEFLYDGGLEF